MKSKIGIFLLTIISFFQITKTSGQKVKGIIVDSLTKEPIMGVVIQQEGKKIGTVSNEDGEFELSVDSYQTNLIFSHISYKTITQNIKRNEFIKLSLPLTAIQLPEVRTGDKASFYIKAAIEKSISDSSNIRYFKAIYQYVSRVNDKYKLFNEILMKVSWTPTGVKEWEPLNIRYSRADKLTFLPSNQIFPTFLYSSILFNYDKFPLNIINPNINYSYAIKHYQNKGLKNEIVVISCKPKNYNGKNAVFEGDIYILTENDNLLKIKGKFIGQPKSNIKHHVDNIDIDYKIDKFGYPVIEKVGILEERTHKNPKLKISNRFWLYYYDEIEGFGKEPKFPAYNRSEVEILKTIHYKEADWVNVPNIEQPNLSKDVLKSFEKGKDGFKSNYTNE